MFNVKLSVSLDNHVQNFWQILLILSLKLSANFEYFIHRILIHKRTLRLLNFVNQITPITTSQSRRLYAKAIVSSTRRRTSSVIQIIFVLPLLLFSSHPGKTRLQIVWVDVLSMQKSQNFFESFLGATHLTIFKSLSFLAPKIQLA